MKDKLIFVFIGFILIILIFGLVLFFKNAEKIDDSSRFVSEYKEVSKDNVFVYKNASEIIDILEKGTGVVYLGFPECPWCQSYVKILNEVAKDKGIEKIYYFNIKKDRDGNTKSYKKIINLTNKYLENDEEGQKRVFVPDVYVVLNGKILSHNNETSIMEDGMTPEKYWTKEKVQELEKTFSKMFDPIVSKTCTTCN